MKITDIFRYPVKSIGYERRDNVALEPGRPFPQDRRYAISHSDGEWDADNPAWIDCNNFLRIVHIPALSAVSVAFDPETEVLTVMPVGAEQVEFDLGAVTGRQALADWAGGYAERLRPGPYQVAEVAGQTLTDSSGQTPSLMSHASLTDLGQKMGCVLNPLRFRGNIWFEGAAPWDEMTWVGREFQIGTTVVRVKKPIERCLAIAANPETGQRDVNPLKGLKDNYGHTVFGMHLDILQGGVIAPGDAVQPL